MYQKWLNKRLLLTWNRNDEQAFLEKMEDERKVHADAQKKYRKERRNNLNFTKNK